MTTTQIIGVALSALIAALGLIKIELIKKIVTNAGSSKKDSGFFAVIILIIVTVIPAVLGFALSDNPPSPPKIDPFVEKQEAPKTDAEVILEAGKTAMIAGNEIAQTIKAVNAEKQKVYLENRGARWVFIIGDMIDIKNDEAILSTAKQLSSVDNLAIFRSGSNVIFFQNTNHSFEELQSALGEFKSHVDLPVKIFNLMTNCSYRNPNIVNKRHIKVGKRREKIALPCYVCD